MRAAPRFIWRSHVRTPTSRRRFRNVGGSPAAEGRFARSPTAGRRRYRVSRLPRCDNEAPRGSASPRCPVSRAVVLMYRVPPTWQARQPRRRRSRPVRVRAALRRRRDHPELGVVFELRVYARWRRAGVVDARSDSGERPAVRPGRSEPSAFPLGTKRPALGALLVVDRESLVVSAKPKAACASA